MITSTLPLHSAVVLNHSRAAVTLLPQVSAPSAAEPAHRGLDRQIGEHRI